MKAEKLEQMYQMNAGRLKKILLDDSQLSVHIDGVGNISVYETEKDYNFSRLVLFVKSKYVNKQKIHDITKY